MTVSNVGSRVGFSGPYPAGGSTPPTSPKFYEGIMKELIEKLKGIKSHIDGKTIITYMKDNNWKNWKQMEYAGFWFEEYVRQTLNLPEGNRYGKCMFDCLYNGIDVDCKFHSILKKDGTKNKDTLGNSLSACRESIKKNGYFYLIVANAYAEYDYDNTFAQWVKSLYTQRTNKRHNYSFSRMRKKAFNIKNIVLYKITEEVLNNNKSFQEGFTNSNGKRRNAKVAFSEDNLPEPEIIIELDT